MSGPVRRRGGKKTEEEKMDDVVEDIQAVPVEVSFEDKDGGEGEGDEEQAVPYEKPVFAPLGKEARTDAPKSKRKFNEVRRVTVPPNRMTPLKGSWLQILQALVEHLKLQVRMNTKKKCVEIRASEETEEIGYLQKGEDFLKAFILGFEIQDAIALLRLDDLYVDSFQVKDVKKLQGFHLSRGIGRIAGKDGKTKYAIENSTRTRIVLANDKVHILGSFSNAKLARDAICSLILGSPPSKVYQHLRTVSKRLQERL